MRRGGEVNVEAEVEDLVPRDAATMQRWTEEVAMMAVKRVTVLLADEHVQGQHRKQLQRALELLTEAAEYLGPVALDEEPDIPAEARAA